MSERKSEPASIDRQLQRIRALNHRAVRDREHCFWLEGVRQFVRACDAGYRFDAIFLSPILLKNSLAEKLARRLAASGVPRVRLTPEQFRSISSTAHASGIGAIARQRWLPLQQTEQRQGLCWLVVEQIRSPGNLGSILRTAEAVGAKGLVILDHSCDPFHPAVVRASMGGLFSNALVRTSHDRLHHWINDGKMNLVALAPDGEQLWTDLPSLYDLGIVIGEERNGISPALRSLCHATVRLPIAGGADSLNVAVAAGVMMYELVRRSPTFVSGCAPPGVRASEAE